MSSSERRSDSGAASIYVLAAALLLLAVSIPVAVTGTLIAAHRKALGAADFAALAGAQRSLTEADAACSEASRVASRNGAQLIDCELASGALTVTVEVLVNFSVANTLAPHVTATSRAGTPTLSGPPSSLWQREVGPKVL